MSLRFWEFRSLRFKLRSNMNMLDSKFRLIVE